MASQIHKPPTALIGVAVLGALLLILLAIIALIEYAGFAMRDEVDAKVLTRPSPELAALRALEARRLSRYQWVDRKKGIVRIPVDRALELTLRDWSRP